MYRFKKGDIVWNGISMLEVISAGENGDYTFPYRCRTMYEDETYNDWKGFEDDWKLDDSFKLATEAEIILYGNTFK
jgi:hypothetical protein